MSEPNLSFGMDGRTEVEDMLRLDELWLQKIKKNEWKKKETLTNEPNQKGSSKFNQNHDLRSGQVELFKKTVLLFSPVQQ